MCSLEDLATKTTDRRQDEPTNPNALQKNANGQRLFPTSEGEIILNDSSQRLLSTAVVNNKSQRLLSTTLVNDKCQQHVMTGHDITGLYDMR